MSFIALTSTEIDADSPGSDQLFTKIKDNFDYLYSAVGSLEQLPVNGSLEIDSDSDGTPDNWTAYTYTGGSKAYDTTTPFHGAKAIKFTRALGVSNGGGYLETGYLEINEALSFLVKWASKSSAAGVKNIVKVRYFTAAKVDLSSDEDIFTSTSNPSSWTQYTRFAIPPATARYCKVRFIGGYTDTNVAGDIYFDDIRIDMSPDVIPVTFTIAEYAVASPTYSDLNSASVRLPKGFSRLLIPVHVGVFSGGYYYHNTGTVDLDISALSGTQTLYLQAKTDGSTYAAARARISTTYSTELHEYSAAAMSACAKKSDNWALCVRAAA